MAVVLPAHTSQGDKTPSTRRYNGTIVGPAFQPPAIAFRVDGTDLRFPATPELIERAFALRGAQVHLSILTTDLEIRTRQEAAIVAIGGTPGGPRPGV